MADRAIGGQVDIRLSTSEDDGRWVVHVTGDLDAASSPAFRRQLLEIADGGKNRIVLDLHGLDLIDSSGLGALVGVQKRLVEWGGELQLRGLQPGPRRVLRLTGLDRVFIVLD